MQRTSALDETFQVVTKLASVTVKADPLDHDFDTVALGRPVAEAIKDKAVRDIKGITAAGRDGHRLFNRTGELANGMEVIANNDEFSIAAPADRLQDPDVVARLYEACPGLSVPLDSPEVESALAKTLDSLIKTRRG